MPTIESLDRIEGEFHMMDYLLALLKFVVPTIIKREKAPVIASPSSSTLVFDSRDAAIYSLCIALVATSLIGIILAILVASRR